MTVTVKDNTVETTGDKGFGLNVTTWPTHDAALAYGRLMAGAVGADLVVEP